jgi:hypothetical protein
LNHEPIYDIIKVEHGIESDDADEPIGKPRPVWRKATEDQKLEYNDVLFRRLLRMEIQESVRLCSDVHCKDENHKNDIDKYVEDILTNVSESGHETNWRSQKENPSEENSRLEGVCSTISRPGSFLELCLENC